MGAFGVMAYWIDGVTNYFKTLGVCIEAVEKYPQLQGCVPHHLKTQEMCNEAVGRSPWQLEYVLNHLKTQKMCGKAVEDE